MTHENAPTTPASDSALREVIANTTAHIGVIRQGESTMIQPHTHKVISQADAQPFIPEAPWQGHRLLMGRPGSGNASSANPHAHSANNTGVAQ